MRTKDLMIQAASLNFDIEKSMNNDNIVVVRITSPDEVYENKNSDDYLIEYMNDIIIVVTEYNPDCVIFDELTPYIGFRNLDLLNDSFQHTLEILEERDITGVFIIGEPATQRAKSIVGLLSQNMTGMIELKLNPMKNEDSNNLGIVTITPNIGHPEGEFESEYKIEPRAGITIAPSRTDQKIHKVETSSMILESIKDEIAGKLQSGGIDFNIVRTSELQKKHKYDEISNRYEIDDFKLILNNQIAVFNKTSQIFSLLAIKIDPALQIKKLLSFDQLVNVVENSVEKKDKLCIIGDKVIVLIVDTSHRKIESVLQNIVNWLPSNDSTYLTTVLPMINVLKVEIDENIENSDGMINLLLSDKMIDKFTSLKQ
jgi:circadian clock protein KaiC